MTNKLQQALAAYRAALLETAALDLLWRIEGRLPPSDWAAKTRAAREAVQMANDCVQAEQFTAALMESGFLQDTKA